jgi:predicted aldo/keto reductase-like oxidoreductase
MQYARLGRTGTKVSRLALGTMNFGWHTDESTSQMIMNAALDAGVNSPSAGCFPDLASPRLSSDRVPSSS